MGDEISGLKALAPDQGHRPRFSTLKISAALSGFTEPPIQAGRPERPLDIGAKAFGKLGADEIMHFDGSDSSVGFCQCQSPRLGS